MIKILNTIEMWVVEDENGNINFAMPVDAPILSREQMEKLVRKEPPSPQAKSKEWTDEEVKGYLNQKYTDEWMDTLAYYTVLMSHQEKVKKDVLIKEMGELVRKIYDFRKLTGVLASVTRGTVKHGKERLDWRDSEESAQYFSLNDKYRTAITNALHEIKPF